jgi:hypothetical protein
MTSSHVASTKQGYKILPLGYHLHCKLSYVISLYYFIPLLAFLSAVQIITIFYYVNFHDSDSLPPWHCTMATAYASWDAAR